MKKYLTLILITILLLSIFPSNIFAGDQLTTSLNNVAAFVYKNVNNPTVGSIGGEWAIIGLSRLGYAVSSDYYSKYYSNVVSVLKEKNGVLHEKKYTDYSRVILGLTSIGYDCSNVAGYDLLAYLSDYDKVIWQGINGPIYALIAINSHNYSLSDNITDRYLDCILARQLDNGGFNLSDIGGSGEADIDVTAMALQALSRYSEKTSVKKSIDKALDYLSQVQNENGGFSDNSEVNSQVLLALGCLNISVDDDRFVKNGFTVLDALLSYQGSDGGFKNLSADSSSNEMASEQALYALTGYYRYINKMNPLYDMSDVLIATGDTKEEKSDTLVSRTVEEPEILKNTFKAVNTDSKLSVVYNFKMFSIQDIQNMSINDFILKIRIWVL